MKKFKCLFGLIGTLALLVFAGCESASTGPQRTPSGGIFSTPDHSPIAESEPVITGEYYKEDEVDTKPIPTDRTPPVYPVDLKRNGVYGEAVVACVVTKKGKVAQVQVIRATHTAFGDSAIRAVSYWRFKPATKDGQPVNCLLIFPMGFELGN